MATPQTQAQDKSKSCAFKACIGTCQCSGFCKSVQLSYKYLVTNAYQDTEENVAARPHPKPKPKMKPTTVEVLEIDSETVSKITHTNQTLLMGHGPIQDNNNPPLQLKKPVKRNAAAWGMKENKVPTKFDIYYGNLHMVSSPMYQCRGAVLLTRSLVLPIRILTQMGWHCARGNQPKGLSTHARSLIMLTLNPITLFFHTHSQPTNDTENTQVTQWYK